MTSIKLLHVSARGRHQQEIFQIKGIQAQHTKGGIASPSKKLLNITYLLNYYMQQSPS